MGPSVTPDNGPKGLIPDVSKGLDVCTGHRAHKYVVMPYIPSELK